MYWNINKIICYQRHFNFINGPREIGKTYTSIKWLIKQALEKHKKFIYICRTQDELKSNILANAVAKVVNNEYKEFEFFQKKRYLYAQPVDEEKVSYEIAACIAISEYTKIKKLSFPDYYYLLFDEYMLEEDSPQTYIKGFKEPDYLLSIYQTVDRGRDELTCFFLGNNTVFYNPYHLHPAFKIPLIEPGEIYKDKNVLFQRAVPSPELQEKLNKNKISDQIKNTEYGRMALAGNYSEKENSFITQLSNKSKYQFTLKYLEDNYGIYLDYVNRKVIISTKVDLKCPFYYAADSQSMTEDTVLADKKYSHLKWLGKTFKQGLVNFDSAATKAKVSECITKFIK